MFLKASDYSRVATYNYTAMAIATIIISMQCMLIPGVCGHASEEIF